VFTEPFPSNDRLYWLHNFALSGHIRISWTDTSSVPPHSMYFCSKHSWSGCASEFSSVSSRICIPRSSETSLTVAKRKSATHSCKNRGASALDVRTSRATLHFLNKSNLFTNLFHDRALVCFVSIAFLCFLSSSSILWFRLLYNSFQVPESSFSWGSASPPSITQTNLWLLKLFLFSLKLRRK
jgi:hypothetical protein